MKTLFTTTYRQFHLLIWVGIILLFCMQWVSDAHATEIFAFALFVFGPQIFLTDYLSNRLLPRALKEKKMKRFVLFFIVVVLLTAVLLSSSYFLFHYLETEGYFPGSTIVYLVHSYPIELIAAIPSAVVVNFGFCGVRFFYEHTQLQKVHVEAQLQMLQQQINPHFMFNVLNHIHILMDKDVKLADDLLIKYSEILRYQLYDGKREYVNINHEVQFLGNFIDVEKTRWGREVDVTYTCNVEDGKQQIPPLLLIGFVENAFKHVSRSTGDQGYVKIELEQSGNTVRLHTENSRTAIPAGKPRNASGLGLENIRKRLDILYPNRYKLHITHTDTVYNSQLLLNI